MMERLGLPAGSTEIYTLAISFGMGSKLLGEQSTPKATGGPPVMALGRYLHNFLDDELESLGQSASNAARTLLQERLKVLLEKWANLTHY